MVEQQTEYVDQYISGSAHTISENGTIGQARKIMDTKNADFLVVTRNNSPVYILKKYQILGEEPNTPIVNLAEKLSPAEIVESGTPWSLAAPRLAVSNVLVVTDTTGKAPQIRGTISTYDVKFKTR